MIDQADSTLTNLRSALRSAGLEVRSRRLANGRTYSVRDKASGEVLIRGLTDLDELRNRVWWLLRTRRLRAAGTQAVAVPVRPSCTACGLARVGAFRFCQSCGFDFEPVKVDALAAGGTHEVPYLAPGVQVIAADPNGRADRWPAVPSGTPLAYRSAVERIPTIAAQLSPVDDEPARGRFDGLARYVRRQAAEEGGRQLLIGAALGGLVGAAVSVVLALLAG
ncbi:MAG: hypothetical protein M3Q66_07840 [Chloroflexota bacterium]|nr:hypothetical protein [Chloroflexota bacterium]